ncbi:hypothetical protein M9H77_07905 [Catharanthus roseus]|uniref:Uncharacterized protein n=1 Tax=Catharanthus roseus TaxID=4058 RepID=A0ACC0BW94_CATRO|nr:hypothetical protein M9H77_07905 [Catharanthus roseus]
MGRLALNILKASISTYSATIEIQIGDTLHTILGDKLVSRKCFMASKEEAKSSAIEHSLNQEAIITKDFQPQGDFELFSITSTHSEQKIKIGTTLPSPFLQEVRDILFEYKDIFSIDPTRPRHYLPRCCKHHLGIPPNFRPSPTGAEFVYALKYNSPVSNKFEYEAILIGLHMALAMNVINLSYTGMQKSFTAISRECLKQKEDSMRKYSMQAKALVSRFKHTRFEKVNRRNNQKADELSKAISVERIHGIWLEPLIRKSVDKEILCMNPEDNWMTPIKNYILNGSLLDASSLSIKRQPGDSLLLGEIIRQYERNDRIARMRKWHMQEIGHHHRFSCGDSGEVHLELQIIK